MSSAILFTVLEAQDAVDIREFQHFVPCFLLYMMLASHLLFVVVVVPVIGFFF